MDQPSAWVVRGATLPGKDGRILDLACGGLRHARYLASCGYCVVAADWNPRPDDEAFGRYPERIDYRQANLESGVWPFRGELFGGIVVTNYLHRPLFPVLAEALAPGGVLIYETFATGNGAFGRPTRAEFLLEPGELLSAFSAKLKVLAYEHGEVSVPKPAVVQRLLSRRAA